MLEPVLGNITVEKVLFFLLAYGRGYAKQIADVFGVSINRIQQQLRRPEPARAVDSGFYRQDKTRSEIGFRKGIKMGQERGFYSCRIYLRRGSAGFYSVFAR